MKQILFISDNLCSGGAQRQLVTVAKLLKQEGHNVTVYCYEENNFHAHTLEEAGIPIVWDLAPTNYLKRIFNVRRFVKRGRFDVVISFLPTCNFLNNIAAIGRHKWTVITGERSSRISTFTSRRGKFFAWFQRYADYIVCNSQNACALWNKYLPKYSEKMRVIYNCVNVGEINSQYHPREDGYLHIVVAATYQYLKNPLGLVEALKAMTEEERSRIIIDWYGRSEVSRGNTLAYDETVQAIRQYSLEHVFRVHPDTKEIADIMNQADVVMLLSQFEGLPNVICEGMTLGKPIVMTRVSDYQALVDDSNGVLCDAEDYSSIREAINKMNSFSIDELMNMGAASRKKAHELFSGEKVTAAWNELI